MQTSSGASLSASSRKAVTSSSLRASSARPMQRPPSSICFHQRRQLLRCAPAGDRRIALAGEALGDGGAYEIAGADDGGRGIAGRHGFLRGLGQVMASPVLIKILISLETGLSHGTMRPCAGNRLGRENCSMARTLAVMGDRWTLLVLRDAFMGVRRFEDFEKSLKIARRVLSERLALLVEEGILAQGGLSGAAARYEYRLTEKGLALYPCDHLAGALGRPLLCGRKGPPVLHTHQACGHDFRSVLTCSECGEALDAREVTITRSGRYSRKP